MFVRTTILLLVLCAGACAKKEVERRDAPQTSTQPSTASPPPVLSPTERALREALEGLDGEGQPIAILVTNAGSIECELHVDRAPRTVANFIGLARGTRPWLDARSGELRNDALYVALPFHRIEPGLLAETGDPTGTGRGGPGYTFADELDPSLTHDAPGVLSMSSHGPDTNGSQFFVTFHRAERLDGRYTVFGHCDPDAVRILEDAQAPRLERVDVLLRN